ncbi:cytochrome P450 [Spinellus fusiger]|nr:cytochrome P450 [Spinellus fusiger]
MDILYNLSMKSRPTFGQKIGMASAAIAAFTTLLALKYPDRGLFQEKRPGIYYIPGLPIIGHLYEAISKFDIGHEIIYNLFLNSGKKSIVLLSLGLPFEIITIDPAIVEHILRTNFDNYIKGPQFNQSVKHLLGHGILNADGEQWKWQRKAASHIFNIQNLRNHCTEVFVSEIEIMCTNILDKAVSSHQPIDFSEIMNRYTLDSFVLIGFGINLESLKTDGIVPFAESIDICQEYIITKFINPFIDLTTAISSIFRPWKKNINDHMKIVDKFTENVIQHRREQIAMGEEHHDLLSHFMTAVNEKGETLNNKELRDIIINFVIAGRDTTAQAISWEFYNLALYPDIEKKLLDEVNSKNFDKDMHNAPVLYEAVKNLTYAHAVFYETLRLHPSVPSNQKCAVEDDVLPDGTQIHKGDYICWSSYSMGRSTILWGEDATQFKPERWITPDGTLRHESQGLWPVFNAGPRVCLGQTLATFEALVAMIFLIKRYKFTLVPNQNITYRRSLTLAMKNGMKMFVENRK